MRLAISIGDLNGVSLEIALLSHKKIEQICEPVYCIDVAMLQQGAKLLGMNIPSNFQTQQDIAPSFEIKAGKSTAESGAYSFASFAHAIDLVKKSDVEGIVTLPINKDAWAQAMVPFKGHTDALSAILQKEAIMMLGCEKMFTILFTHHIPLREVPNRIKSQELKQFLLRTQQALHVDRFAVLGLNPHAGDYGLLGDEELKIQDAIDLANQELKKEVFFGPIVPDIAFSEQMRNNFKYFVCMYHDQGLIPLKALYFEESINISLDCGVIRTSVDHGTAFDIAYKKRAPSCKSYINAVSEAVNLALR